MDAIDAIADKRAAERRDRRNASRRHRSAECDQFPTENLFGVFVTQGLATPGEQLPYLMQGGLGLPERDYYLSADPKMAETRNKYKAYVQQMLQTGGLCRSGGRREPHHGPRDQDRERARDPRAERGLRQRRPGLDPRELEQKAPGIDWTALLDAAQLGGAQKFDAYHFAAIPKLSALVGSEPLQNWKDWLAFHTLNQNSNVLPKNFRDASFAFNGTDADRHAAAAPARQAGAQRDQQRAPGRGRQSLCRQIFPGFVQGRDPEDGRQHQGRLRQARGGHRLDGALDQAGSTEEGAEHRCRRWLSRHLARLFGAADHRRQRLCQPESADLAEYRHQFAKIGKPLDRKEWWMPPQLVNAVNLPVQNALNFPAAILASILRPDRGRRLQLWRHRRDDRS